MKKNRQWLIAADPENRALLESDFSYSEADVRDPNENEVQLRSCYFSCDPAQKGWMSNTGGYMAPLHIGDVMRSGGIAQVEQSNHADFKVGDMVTGLIGWQSHPTVEGAGLTKVENDALLTAHLSVLGGTGMTAYFGLFDIGVPKPGDTVVVSGAAGATGCIVGQLAKLAGCRTIGIAGGAEKCDWLTGEVGYDHAIDYKNEDVRGRLKELCKGSVDIFFDNVGGQILDDVLGEIAMKARVIICGGIARYNDAQMPPGPQNYFNVVFKRAKIEGFIVIDYMDQFPMAVKRMRQWIDQGHLHFREDIQEGFENAPASLLRLFTRQNFGKQLVKISDPV